MMPALRCKNASSDYLRVKHLNGICIAQVAVMPDINQETSIPRSVGASYRALSASPVTTWLYQTRNCMA